MGANLVIILALLLRLFNIDKPEGLWNDEYVSWFVSSKPLWVDFWNEVAKQCHMPLYYFYLKPFSGCSDLVLRLLSVLPGLLIIPVMYNCGKFYSEKVAKYSALITATLPFLVYYAQEVRFYSLLAFFSSLLLYYLLKIFNLKKGYIGFLVSSLLILFTHVLGGIYVLAMTVLLLAKKTRCTKWIVILIALFVILLAPLFKPIVLMMEHSQWWGNFSYTNILFLFSDFFSPILTNNINTYPVFFYSKNFSLNFFMLIPTLLASTALIFGILKQKKLFFVSLFVIFIMSLLAYKGLIVFITKYSIEILPILILLVSIGFSKNKLTQSLFVLFVFINLIAVATPFYSTKEPRNEGHKLVAEVLEKRNPDKVLFTYYDDNRFKRYLTKDYNSKYISKINRAEYLDNPSRILEYVHKNEIVSVVFLESVNFIPEEMLEKAKSQGLPEMFITFSEIKAKLLKTLNSNYTDFSIDKNGSWLIITAKKVK